VISKNVSKRVANLEILGGVIEGISGGCKIEGILQGKTTPWDFVSVPLKYRGTGRSF
jgi:hypothetical protein